METHARRSKWIWPTACAALACFTVYMFVMYGFLSVHVAFAHEQVEIFDDMRAKALETSDVSRAVGALEYAINYYPSGTKQETGSELDDIVERARRYAVEDIVAHLRLIAPEVLGDDPEAWLKAY